MWKKQALQRQPTFWLNVYCLEAAIVGFAAGTKLEGKAIPWIPISLSIY